ncbi:chloride channel protein ClC-Kb-like isoform X1 [Protopterus annectens]|uniref:chloride channel protein ClC-Kb-like isoform X1 n=2 Tax=Protopterus annectens TaxID=7888 RepID=UPI001CF9E0C0|nr:chloride channel protein ClC-Kb-like isoform X1 [Protopterus annectens]
MDREDTMKREKYAPTPLTGTEENISVNVEPWKPWPKTRRTVIACLRTIKDVLFRIGDDWYFLFALGVIMAMISFAMDFTVYKALDAHRWLFQELGDNVLLKYLAWTVYPVAFVSFSTGFAQSISPFSAGSGVPELKVILTGVVLEEYLTIKTFGAKVVGMTCTLAGGSIIFLGKVGPFVHISCLVAAYLGRMRTSVTGEYMNNRKRYEMLVAAAAVAVASVFGAPISGVLFSIEVMTTNFAVKDYWRGFFAATCGAFMFRLLAVFNSETETIIALFNTAFKVDFPFDIPEMIFYGILGIICGFVSCAYLFCQRWLLGYIRRNRFTAKLLATDKVMYSALIAFLLASITFPLGLGQFMGSRLTMKEHLISLFDNKQWVLISQNSTIIRPDAVDPQNLWLEWWNPTFTFLGTLFFFVVMKFWMLILATTMPMPAGYFMPVLIYGAGIGRLVGEFLSYVFPNGIMTNGISCTIIPGGYALAGAAAFSGAVTHSLATALLVFEATGQFAHALPVIIATLVANAISQRLQPSFYDGTIIVKKLPFLPQISSACTDAFKVTTEQFMKTGIISLTKSADYTEVLNAVISSNESEYPVVDSKDSMILLGSIKRSVLIRFLHTHSQDQAVEAKDSVNNLSGDLSQDCDIDEITFQLSTQTSLHQAHSMFELLKLHLIYVTRAGKVEGLVTRNELRKAIEDLAAGKLTPLSK